jgi:hypothetical protein
MDRSPPMRLDTLRLQFTIGCPYNRSRGCRREAYPSFWLITSFGSRIRTNLGKQILHTSKAEYSGTKQNYTKRLDLTAIPGLEGETRERSLMLYLL